jgi:hypothetical protein
MPFYLDITLWGMLCDIHTVGYPTNMYLITFSLARNNIKYITVKTENIRTKILEELLHCVIGQWVHSTC